MLKFEPYGVNPFEQEPEFRLQLKEFDDESLYQLFSRNYVAYIYYNNFEILLFNMPIINRVKQMVFQCLNDGNLRVQNVDYPMLDFALMEIDMCETLNTEAARVYKNFLINHTNVFSIIDEIIAYGDNLLILRNTSEFLNSEIKTIQLDPAIHILRMYQFNFSKNVAMNLIRNFHLKNLDYTWMNFTFKEFDHMLNHEYLSESESNLLKESILKAIRQIHKDVNYILKNHKTSFDEFEKSYCRIVKYHKNIGANKDFPRHVFKTYQAYQLFHFFVGLLANKSAINYLYRRMYEKDKLILLKDSDFRTWFNDQDYPVELHESTATLERCHTQEREITLDLLYKAYNINESDF